MTLNIQQRQVASAMLSAIVFSLIYIGIFYYWLRIDLIPTVGEMHRLDYAIRCDLFAVLMLLFGIGAIANQRFFSSIAIGGETPASDRSLVINVRYLQNTLEQLVLLVMTHLGLATLLPIESMRLIPILVSLFIIGRFLFWIGYHRSALSRAFGFAVTFYPTVVCLIYCCFIVMIHK